MTAAQRLANLLIEQNNIAYALEKSAAKVPMTSNVAKWLKQALGMSPAMEPTKTLAQKFMAGGRDSVGMLASGAGKMLPMVALGGLAYGIPYLASKGIDAARRSGEESALERSREAMYEEDPSLMEDPDLAEKHFDILRTFAPAMASHPAVAASYVRGAMHGGDFTHPTEISNLLKAQVSALDADTRRSAPHQDLMRNFSRYLPRGD